jgi:sterol 3beta-glucosyltransferase
VQPYVALGLALRRAGHVVTVATHETFRAFVLGSGLEFVPIAGDPKAILATQAADRWLGSGRMRDLLPAASEFLAGVRPMVDALLADFWRVSQGADVIVYSAVAGACTHVAEALGVPSVGAFLQPLHRTREFPALGVPSFVRWGGRFNEATWAFSHQLFWVPFRRQINAWRQATLGLAPVTRQTRWPWHVPTVYGYSPRVMPRPSDWPSGVTVASYWVLPPDAGWSPPPALAAFLAAGPPPVSIGFGSMTPRRAERWTAMAVDALDRAGQRGVLLGGWGELGAGSLPPTVLAVGDVPHEWLFPRMAAVVHHGGAGTTGAALRGGAPSIVVPFSFDQPFWADRVATLGVGPRPISRRRITAPALAAAISAAVNDDAMRARAFSLGAALRAEDGAGMAVAIIERAQPVRVRQS